MKTKVFALTDGTYSTSRNNRRVDPEYDQIISMQRALWRKRLYKRTLRAERRK